MAPRTSEKELYNSANSEDPDQLLHLSSHISELDQQCIIRIIQTEPGKSFRCWGSQAELSLLFVHATRRHSV